MNGNLISFFLSQSLCFWWRFTCRDCGTTGEVIWDEVDTKVILNHLILNKTNFFLTDPPTVVSCKKSQSESLHTSNRSMGGKSKYQLEFIQLIFILQYVCGLKSGFWPWRPCWLQIQEDHSLNLLIMSLFSSQTILYFKSGCKLVLSSIFVIIFSLYFFIL